MVDETQVPTPQPQPQPQPKPPTQPQQSPEPHPQSVAGIAKMRADKAARLAKEAAEKAQAR